MSASSSMPKRPSDPLDLIDLDSQLTDEEKAIRAATRQVCADVVDPHVMQWYEDGELPARELALEFGKVGLLGMHLEGYGCAGMSAVDYGLACLELEASDSGIRSLVSVQGSLAMFAIWRFGTEEHKQQWLPRMAAGEAIGCFGLTEPDHGSDPASMRTRARRDGDDWVLNGSKMWITNGSIADVAVVWANAGEENGGIRGFVVPTDTPGFAAHKITHKMSLRASVTSELTFENLRLPADAVFPDVTGLKGPLACLSEARYGIVWGALGAARSSLDARPPLLHGAHPVRPADRRVPADPGQAREHGDRAAAGPAARPAPRAAQGQRRAAPRAGLGRQVQQHHQVHRDLPHGPHHPRRQRGERGVPRAAAREQPRVGAHLRGDRGDAHARRSVRR